MSVAYFAREGTIVCRGSLREGFCVGCDGRVGGWGSSVREYGREGLAVGEGLCYIQYFYQGSAKSHGPFLQQVAWGIVRFVCGRTPSYACREVSRIAGSNNGGP